MPTKKKLLILSSTFPRWAGDTLPPFVYELSRRLLDAFEVHVLAPASPGALDSEIMAGVHVHRFHYFLRRYEKLAGSGGILPALRRNKAFYFQVPFYLAGLRRAVERMVREIAPDVVHAHWLVPQGAIAASVCRTADVPYVVTAHGADVFGLQMAAGRAAKRYALRHAAAVTAVSRPLASEIVKIYPDCSAPRIISMGVDAARFKRDAALSHVRAQFSPKGPLLLFVGRLEEKKGVGYLIEAMPPILEKFPSATLLIVGTGSLEPSLKNLSRSLNLEDSIIFAGSVQNNDLPAYYSAADVFIGPSVRTPGGDTEGLGLTFIEAGLSGCALVGSDVGGIPDLIRDGETGLLVPEKDGAAIAHAVMRLLGDPAFARRLAMEARSVFERDYDWGIVSAKYAELLLGVCRP